MPRVLAAYEIDSYSPDLSAGAGEVPKVDYVRQETIANRYRVERLLGRGATANVYLAHDGSFGRAVAVKVLLPDVAHAVGVERFLREIRLTARMQHPHIVAIHDSGVWNDLPYFVMPYMEGGSLRERLQREPQLPLRDVARITSEVADALSYAHQYGLVHRDIKPENILFTGDHALVADFGIARVTSDAAGISETTTGLIRGTPAYMSPEQASGDGPLDGRSDLYSLACVVYEMIAGVPPFVGPTDRIVMAQRLSHAPPPLKVYRSSVPAAAEKAVASAMTINVADREGDPRALANALASSLEATSRASVATFRFRRWRPVALAAGAMAVTAAAVWLGNPREFIQRLAPLDSLHVAVASLASDASSNARRNRVSAAVSEWRDVTVSAVDSTGVSIPHALESARRAGARWLIALQATPTPDTLALNAALWDVASSSQVRRFRGASGALVADLLGGDDVDPSMSAEGSTSLISWREFVRGRAELRHWRLVSAANSLGAAMRGDRGLAAAAVWTAQVQSWQRQPLDGELTTALKRALESGARLSTRDSLVARAVLYMGGGNYPAACSAYNALLARDSLDVVAWLGLGDCQTRDKAVVRNVRKPSSWRFRSSYQSGLSSYLRAAQIEPGSVTAFVPLDVQGVLFTNTNVLILGSAVPPDTTLFAAYPTLDLKSDTILLLPYPRRALLTAAVGPSSAAEYEAIDKLVTEQRQLGARLARAWVKSSPDNPDAHEMLARALELTQEISPSESEERSAPAAASSARKLSVNPHQQLRLASMQIRLDVKAGAFNAARVRTDSTLREARLHSASADPADASLLAALAGLVGRKADVQRWMDLSDLGADSRVAGDSVIPAAARSDVLGFFATAAIGQCDSVDIALKRAEGALERFVPPATQGAAWSAAMPPALSLAVPCDGGRAVLRVRNAADPLIQVQQAFARHEVSSMHAQLRALETLRSADRPGDVALDYTFQESWILAQAGDTVTALRRLRQTLESLPTLGADFSTQVAQTAALCRTLELAAHLVARSDPRLSGMWATQQKQLCAPRSA